MPRDGWIPAAFIRGGTSKGLFFEERELPGDPRCRDAFLLSAMGSPDPYGRQLDGMGGGLSSLSKAVIVAPSGRAGVDVDYTFAQIAIDRPIVDYSSNCGNLASAVGPFAVDQGVVERPDGAATVRMYNTNTGKTIDAHFEVADGTARVDGDLAIPGVGGAGAPVRLDFLDPGGSRTGRLLPSGAEAERIDTRHGPIEASLVDAGNPVVFVTAEAAGIRGDETVAELESLPGVLSRLEEVRCRAAVVMGLCATPDGAPFAAPKVAVVAPPSAYSTLDGTPVGADAYDLSVRTISSGQVHRAIPVTTALCAAVADALPGTVVARTARDRDGALRIGSPSGVFATEAEVDDDGRAVRASLYRTCRRLMQGSVPLRPESPLTG
ncbi:2-methylaconitate cis-trans isomerase PrpF family protein [Tsukamurella sp. 1534]|uniref:2-methylaconitate cis-trans isomerase PrpF family protein n=1 Tax=Tsukamurella sp. 1534 TaxID=1151061 RepID=UPI0002D4EDD2|nr:PrpF domain-containing protein [Tsukamurella sp. 1534]